MPSKVKQRQALTDAMYLRAGLGRVVDAEVGRLLGVSRQAVALVRKRLGIPPAPEVTDPAEAARVTKAVEAVRQGATRASAARLAGLPVTRIMVAAKGLPRPHGKPRRDQVADAQLVREVLDRQALADALGISLASLPPYISRLAARGFDVTRPDARTTEGRAAIEAWREANGKKRAT